MAILNCVAQLAAALMPSAVLQDLVQNRAAGGQSAAAALISNSDPPKIRVVVRKRPINAKVRSIRSGLSEVPELVISTAAAAVTGGMPVSS